MDITRHNVIKFFTGENNTQLATVENEKLGGNLGVVWAILASPQQVEPALSDMRKAWQDQNAYTGWIVFSDPKADASNELLDQLASEGVSVMPRSTKDPYVQVIESAKEHAERQAVIMPIFRRAEP